jgi:hypothetical protein
MAASRPTCSICGSSAKEKCYRSLSSKTSVSQFEYCLKVLNIEGIDGIACNLCVNKLNRINKLNNDLNDKLRVIREQRDALINTLKEAPGVKKYAGSAQQAKVCTPKGEKVVVYFTPKGIKRPSQRETPTPSNRKALKKLFTSPRKTPSKPATLDKGTQTKVACRAFEVKVNSCNTVHFHA